MSSLLVDIGNSRLKWAVKRDGVLESGKPVDAIHGHLDFDENWKKLRAPKRVLVSNVQGEKRSQGLQEWVRVNWLLSAEFIRVCNRAYGIENGYRDPDQLGVDRWVCMIAVRAFCQDPVCVVDCGTAITADVLDSMGRHQGGVICPGVTLMQNALVQGTSALTFEGVARDELLGRDTDSGIYTGTLTAAAGLIEKLLVESELSLQTRLKLVVTGGAAEVVVARLRGEYELIPDLVLRGLSVIESCENIGVKED